MYITEMLVWKTWRFAKELGSFDQIANSVKKNHQCVRP